MEVKTKLTIPENLQAEIIDFALISGTGFFKSNSVNGTRRFCNVNLYNVPLQEKIREFSRKSYRNMGITEITEEHLFGNFIGVNLEHGFVHQHKDPRGKNNEVHVRLNFMLQKPVQGGDPIINGNVLSVHEGESWINFASEWTHSSTPVKGSRERVVLSLGNYIAEDNAFSLL